jgi:hypothetical protein
MGGVRPGSRAGRRTGAAHRQGAVFGNGRTPGPLISC